MATSLVLQLPLVPQLEPVRIPIILRLRFIHSVMEVREMSLLEESAGMAF
jgi:hypothetical protein